MKFFRKIIIFSMISLLLVLFAFTQKAKAASFDAGRIIDDAIFTNKNSMSVGDIQNFLNSKMPACNTNHGAVTGDSGTVYNPPWICLKDYYEKASSTYTLSYEYVDKNGTSKVGYRTYPDNNYFKYTSLAPVYWPDSSPYYYSKGIKYLRATILPIGGAAPIGSVSAAQIIYNAAQTYGINPQALLVTLQKENGLITDDWPYPWQYLTATGFACPDGGECDPAYYGFTNQVNQLARHFRNFYDLNPSWYIPYRPGSNYIKWAPFDRTNYLDTCGGSNVNIQNRATAALYSYTPYQPNAAALNNLYGTGDSCSSYGNRNFWRDFNNWFGTTYGEVNETNINWSFESLDGSPTSISGQDGAVGQTPKAIQFGNSIQVFYYDVTNGNLKRSYENGSGWVTETLDGSGGVAGRINADVGKMPAAAIYNNQLHVFYFDVTNGDLRHGVSDTNGGNWTFETLDGDSQTGGRTTAKVGVNPAAAVYGNTLQVFHYDDTAGNIRHVWFTPGVGWSNENLDGDPGSIGRANANLGEDPEVVIYNNEIQLYYYDLTYGNLRHAWTTSRGWAFENLDGDPGSVGRSSSNLGRNPSVTVHNGQLQLFYYDVQYGNLRHAWTTSRGWAFENLDGDPGSIFGRIKNTGITPKVASYNNVLYLFYYDQTDGELRYAYADNTGWHKASLDGGFGSISKRDSNAGIDPTVIPYGNYMQLFYYDFSNNDLRHTWGLAP
jgi:hypothetical protein